MKAIILTAGQGKRLRPLTDDCPKGMVKVNGNPILNLQIDLFRKAGINDISIVKGYKAESVITDANIKHYFNKNYETTNMVYSLLCAFEELKEDVIISYGDIIYTKEVLNSILNISHEISVVVDMEWKTYFKDRFDDPFFDAESLIMDTKNIILQIGEQHPKKENIHAQYIGLIRVREEGISMLKKVYSNTLETNNKIGWGRSIKECYVTDLLQEIINIGGIIHAVPIHGGWVEIDSIRDHRIAERKIKEWSNNSSI